MIDNLYQKLKLAFPQLSGIYQKPDGTIGHHAQLTEVQQLQFDMIVTQWREDAPKAEAIYALWLHVNQLYISERVSKGWDENASSAVTLWAALGEITQARAAKLADVRAWGDSAWQLYYQVKAQIDAGEEYSLPSLPAACPWHFANVLFADA
jgi:hypothetical protein